MSWQQNLVQNLLAFAVLLSIFVLIYCKVTGKTLGDIFMGIKDSIFGGREEATDLLQGGFETIR